MIPKDFNWMSSHSLHQAVALIPMNNTILIFLEGLVTPWFQYPKQNTHQ